MTNGAYGLFESQMPAGFSPPLHVHHGEDEAFWVLEGNFSFRCGDQTIRVGPPDIARLKQVSPKYKLEILGPPMSKS